MATSLVPCPACARHVRASERACPFCRSALSSALAAQAVPASTQRLSRAAAFTFAASLAATGCSSDPAPADAAVVDVGLADTGTDTGATTDTNVRPDTGVSPDAGFPADDGGFLAMYGSPPDSGVDAGGPDDNGGIMPLYGLPPPDAGQTPTDDGRTDGSIGVRYGAPPPPDSGI